MIGFHSASKPFAKKLRPVVESWMEILSAYNRREREDALWWYNERATLSSLAGAAWRVPSGRWMAIEEFISDKRARVRAARAEGGESFLPRGHVESGAVSSGRVDLHLGNGHSNFAFEAKQAWQPIGDESKDRGVQVRKAMKGAWKDAGHLLLDEGDHRLACTFVVPYISPTCAERTKGNISSVVESWLKERVWGKRQDAVAYHFPATARNLRSERGYIYPGVVMLVRERKKAVRQPRAPLS